MEMDIIDGYWIHLNIYIYIHIIYQKKWGWRHLFNVHCKLIDWHIYIYIYVLYKLIGINDQGMDSFVDQLPGGLEKTSDFTREIRNKLGFCHMDELRNLGPRLFTVLLGSAGRKRTHWTNMGPQALGDMTPASTNITTIWLWLTVCHGKIHHFSEVNHL